jgi:hypothetical protein
MWGRGLRSSPETGKKDCLLLDFSGNIVRFHEDYESIYFNGLEALDSGEKLDKTVRSEETEPKGCPKCGFTPFKARCMACGYERKTQSAKVEALPGEMQEVFVGQGSRRKKIADSEKHLWEQCCSYARAHSMPEKQSGRAWHLFKKITGKDALWRFSTTPTVELTMTFHNKVQQLNTAFRKATSVKGLTR